MFPIFEIQGTFNFGVMNASSSSALKKRGVQRARNADKEFEARSLGISDSPDAVDGSNPANQLTWRISRFLIGFHEQGDCQQEVLFA